MLRRLLVSIELSRPHNMLAAALCLAAGYRVAGGRELGVSALAAVVAALATGAGNVINDWFDVEIDRVNKPRRPLPSERINRRAAVVLYASLSVVGLVLSFAGLPGPVAWLVVAWHVALFAYAASLKRVVVAGNVLVAAVTSSAFVAGAWLAGSPGAALVPFSIAFVFVLSREVVKGAEDVGGDSESGVGTLAVVAGVGRAAGLAAVMMLCLAALIPLPALVRFYSRGYFWTMELAVVPSLFAGAILVTRRQDRETFGRVSWILKFGMFFGILAIALGRG